ncbi:GerAB/ArcD/ProY family transporter, partial [Weissella cibaria]|uniref:GerAB/ArcD/ProY family transporter n=1 Tax=Weissella cibaria TaxID=137591 RepID=UPI00143F51E6
GLFDIKSLEPVLGNGIKPVLDVVYPEILIFPFGETVLFLMYWKHVNSKNLIRKTSIMAMGLFGIIVTCSTLIIISVLVVDYASIATVPLLEVIKTINIGELLTNMYAIAVVIIFIGGFYKTLLNLLGGLLGFSALFNIKVKYIILPACVLTL